MSTTGLAGLAVPFLAKESLAAGGSQMPANSSGTTSAPATGMPPRTSAVRSGKVLPNVQATLAPYSNPLTFQLAAHLLRRTGFGPRYSEVNALVGVSASTAVANMMTTQAAPAPPGNWVYSAPLLDSSKASQTTNQTNMQNFRDWWMGLIYGSAYPPASTAQSALLEKMTLFWENHFVTEFAKVLAPQYLYWKNTMLRQNAFGNFQNIVQAITIDNAMLWYLDGWTSIVGNVNENYAREVMELFTIGPSDPNGNPNYSQTDIENSAKALTGWTLYGFTPSPLGAGAMSQYTPGTYNAALHDTSTKTFLSQTGNFGNTDVINIIFQQTFNSFMGNSTVYNKVALFICKELYGLFIYDNPGEPTSSDYSSYCNPTNPIIQQMAVTFAQNNFSIQAVLQQLLTSQFFFDPSVLGDEIKSPVEFVVSASRQLEVTTLPPDYLYQQSFSITGSNETQLDQPPNVAGFPGYESWINAATLPQRNQFSDGIISGVSTNGTSYSVDTIAFAQLVCNNDATVYNDATQLILACAAFLLPFPLDTDTTDPSTKISALQTALLSGASVSDWSTAYPGAAASIGLMLQLMLKLADYQLA